MLRLRIQYSGPDVKGTLKVWTTKTFLSDFFGAQVSVEMATKISPGGSQWIYIVGSRSPDIPSPPTDEF